MPNQVKPIQSRSQKHSRILLFPAPFPIRLYLSLCFNRSQTIETPFEAKKTSVNFNLKAHLIYILWKFTQSVTLSVSCVDRGKYFLYFENTELLFYFMNQLPKDNTRLLLLRINLLLFPQFHHKIPDLKKRHLHSYTWMDHANGNNMETINLSIYFPKKTKHSPRDQR